MQYHTTLWGGVVTSKNELGIETRTGGSQKDSMRFLEKFVFLIHFRTEISIAG